MADKNYIILKCGTKIQISEEIYKEYNRAKVREKNRYRDDKKRIVSLEEMCEFGNELSVLKLQKSVEDIVLDNLMKEKLQEALLTLSKDEQILLNEIYYNRRTEREMAKMLNISQFGVNKRKNKALERLRQNFKK